MNSKKNVFTTGAMNRPDQSIQPSSVLVEPSRLSIFKAALNKSPVAPDVNLVFLAENTRVFGY